MGDLTTFHGFQDSVRWRLTADGLDIEGEGVTRTPGTPATVTKVWADFAADINAAAQAYDIPCVLIVATVCTESGGDPAALRLEPGYLSDEQTPDKVSSGLMQTLISTARAALGNATLDRPALLHPATSLMAGTAQIASQRGATSLDPPLVAAAYDTGSVRHDPSPGNRWRLVQYPIGTGEHCDRFVKWFNDAVLVLAGAPIRPAVGYEQFLLGGGSPTPAPAPAPSAQSFAAAGEVAPGAAAPEVPAQRFPADFQTTEAVEVVAIAQSFAAAGEAAPGAAAPEVPAQRFPADFQATEALEGVLA